MPTLDEYAQLSSRVYRRTDDNRTPVPIGWEEQTWLPDGLLGLSAGVYRRGNEVVIAFTGTNEKKYIDFALGNIPLATGGTSPQVFQALSLYFQVKQNNPGANITFTGHSLGGGLASILAVFFDKAATVFDPAPLEAGARGLVSTAQYLAWCTANGWSESTFTSYATSPNLFLFAQRELNVSGISVEGEILSSLRTANTAILGGPEQVIPIGAQSILSLGLSGRISLHSMTLLASMQLSQLFREAVQQNGSSLEAFCDPSLYTFHPEVSQDRNFLDALYIGQVSGTHVLDKLGADLKKILGSGMTYALQRGLTVAAMEHYYPTFNPTPTTAFFTDEVGALHFRFDNTLLPKLKAPGILHAALAPYVQEVPNVSSFFLKGAAWHVQAGSTGLIWTGSGDIRDFAIGGAQTDVLDGGEGDDLLVGGLATDFLTGGDGNDTLSGGYGADQLRGGRGSDLLVGGADADTYIIATGEGRDVVLDFDGLGSLIVDGMTLGEVKPAGRSAWVDQNGFRFTFVPRESDTKGALNIKSANGTDVAYIARFDLSKAFGEQGYLGINLPEGQAVALVSNVHAAGTGGNPYSNWNFDSANLNGSGSSGVTHAFTIFLSRAAGPAATIALHLGDLAGKGLKAVLGDSIVDAEGAILALAEGQTEVSFALVADAGFDEDITGAVSATFIEDSESVTSNAWSLTWTASPDVQSTVVGDQAATPRDLLDGSSGADLIRGLTDNDALRGMAGPDQIEGGAGTDILMGGVGSDTLKGEAGDDVIYGSSTGSLVQGVSLDVQNIIGLGQNWVYYGAGANDPDGFRRTYLDGIDRDIQQGDAGNEIEGGDGNDVVFAGTGDDLAEGGEGRDDIVGMGGSDVLLGDAGDDRLSGDGSNFANQVDYTPPSQAGADFLDGGTGNDIVLGQGANDDVFGGDGDDRLWGDDRQPANTPAESHGIDYLDGELGNDTMYGGGKSDELYGGAGNDEMWGDEFLTGNIDASFHGDDYLDAEDGDDSLWGGGRDDVLFGGLGNDIVYGDDPLSERTPEALQGRDYLDGEGGDDSLVGGAKEDDLFGDEGNDLLWGDDGGHAVGETGSLDPASDGNDYLDGEAGHDTLVGEGGADVLFGGDGDDSLVGDDRSASCVAAWHGDDSLDGEAGDDSLVGNGGADVLAGGVGNDVLLGDAADVPQDKQGDDELDGGEGDDGLKGHGGDDVLQGGIGNDTLEGDAGFDLLTGGEGDDVLDGSEGDDVLEGEAGSDSLKGQAGDDDVSGGEGSDQLEGGDGNDMLAGEAADDSLYGGEGDDYIDGAEGNDYLQGDGGIDIVSGGGGDDFARGEAGDDELYGDAGNDQLQGNDGNDYIDGGEGNDILFGQEGNDTLWGLIGADTLQGDGGDDVLFGGADSATLLGGAGHDVLFGGDSADHLQGGSGNDTLDGGAGNDTLLAQEGDNVIDGGAGADALVAGAGANTLRGGEGADRFTVAAGSGAVTIEDADGDDRIFLTGQTLQDAQAAVAADGSVNIAFAGGTTIALQGNANFEFNGTVFTGAELVHYITLTNLLSGGSGGGGGGTADPDGGGVDTLGGGADGELLTGGPGMDDIHGEAGNDTIVGLGGMDFLHGGDGDDSLSGGDGNDVLLGDAGRDTLMGEGGDDSLFGHADDDALHGGAGDDNLSAGAGNDTLVGGVGDDVLTADESGTKTYVFNPGDGNDILKLAPGSRAIRFGPGVEPGSLEVFTSPAGVVPAFVLLAYGDGDSILIELATGDASAQAITYEFADVAGGPISHATLMAGIQQGGVAPRVVLGTSGHDQLQAGASAAILQGLAGNDQLTGSPQADTLQGGAGADSLQGAQGNDELAGGVGNDVMLGGEGSDTYTYYKGGGSDTIMEEVAEGDADRLRLGDLSFGEVSYLRAANGSLLIRIEGTDDAIEVRNWWGESANRLSEIVYQDGSTQDLAALEVLEVATIVGTGDAEEIHGTAFADEILAMAGDDTIDGHQGDDFIDGGAGTDHYTLRRGMDLDTIAEANGESSVLLLDAELSFAQLIPTRQGDDLRIEFTGGTPDGVILKGYYAGAAGWSVENSQGEQLLLAELVASYNAGAAVEPSISQLRQNWLDEARSRYLDKAAASADASGLTWQYVDAFTLRVNASIPYELGFQQTESGSDAAYFERQSNTGSGLDHGMKTITYEVTVPSPTWSFTGDLAGSTILTNYGLLDANGNPTHYYMNSDGSFTIDPNQLPDLSSQSYYLGGTITFLVKSSIPTWFEACEVIEHIVGGDGDNVINVWGMASVDAGAGNDVIWNNTGDTDFFAYGAAGNDTIFGSWSDREVLIGGQGDDYLVGLEGDDTYYILASEPGVKIVDEVAESWTVPEAQMLGTVWNSGGIYSRDTLEFGPGVTLANLQIGKGTYDSAIDSSSTVYDTIDFSWGEGRVVRVLLPATPNDSPQNDGYGIECVRFADGTTLAMQQVIDMAGQPPPPTAHAPQAELALPDRAVDEDSPAGFAVAPGSFTDADGDALNYTATMADGTALPSWMAFDPVDQTFDATAQNGHAGTYEVRVTATDPTGLSASQTFTVTVSNVNDAPTAVGTLDAWNAMAGVAASYTFDASAFEDVDAGDVLACTATLADGSPLPAWLSFDAATHTLSGTPVSSDGGRFIIRITATDLADASAHQDIDLLVKAGLNLVGASGADSLTGGAGADTLDGFAGADRLAGGQGNDIYFVDNAGDTVVEGAGEGYDTVHATVSMTIAANVEKLVLAGTSGIDAFGGAGDDYLQGNTGDNRLVGQVGRDTLDGGGGKDTLAGGQGDDVYFIYGAGSIQELAGEGVDTVYATSLPGSNVPANVEIVILTGEADVAATGNAAAESIAGNAGDNAIAGGGGNDTLCGNAGNDTLDGGAGVDSLVGGTGNDTYVIDSASDVVVELAGEGVDRIVVPFNHTLAADSPIENLTITGTATSATGNSGNNSIVGNANANTLRGLGGNDYLDGAAGADTLIGGEGNDTYAIDNAGDVASETASGGTADRIRTGSIELTLPTHVEHLTLTGSANLSGTGNAAANQLTGNAGNNWLGGAAGNDTLDGGAGSDTLLGGSGDDIYVLARGHGQDSIQDSGGADAVSFGDGIAIDQLWFTRDGKDLIVAVIGTADAMRLTGWYGAPAIEQFQAADGSVLPAGSVQRLVDAMAAYEPPAVGQTVLPLGYQQALGSLISDSWL